MDIPKETRLESYEQITPVAEIRKKMILEILHTHFLMTAQEIATELNKLGHIPTDERNYTAPRLTELRKEGKVKPFGKKQCAKTGRKVTVWVIVKEGEELNPGKIRAYKKAIREGVETDFISTKNKNSDCKEDLLLE